jgi:translation initiation factor IF-3
MRGSGRTTETRIGEGHGLSRDLRVNEMIRIPQVRVIDEEGSQLGVMPTAQALQLAQERGLDLVEVAPLASPPVTRLLDFGQYKYEQARKEKEARRHQRSVEFKEIRLKPKIGRDLLNRFADLIKDHGAVDRQPLLEGRSMSMTVTSVHKPRAQAPSQRDDGAERASDAAPAATAAPPPNPTAQPAETAGG